MHRPRQPVHFVTGLESDGERLSCRQCGPPCRFDRGFDLHQRQAGVVEKGFARSGQLDALNAARQQLGPDLVLQIANLPAQRGLGGVEPALGGGREAAFLDHGHEVTQVPQLHSRSMPERYATSLQSLFQDRNARLHWLCRSSPVYRQTFVVKRVTRISHSPGVAQ
jgi:hypothetical protein